MNKIKLSAALTFAILINASAHAETTLSNGAHILVGPNQIIKLKTPFMEPGVVAGNQYEIEVERDLVFIRLNPQAAVFSQTDLHIFDRASRPTGATQTIRLFIDPVSDKQSESEYKIRNNS